MKFHQCAFIFLTLLCPLISAVDKDSIKGAIIGAALGDALGRVTEFIDTTNKIHKKYGKLGVTSFKSFKNSDWVTDPKTKKKIAAYTDDTVMSLIILKHYSQGLLQNTLSFSPGYNVEHMIAADFVQLFGDTKYTIDPLYDVRAHGPTNIHAAYELKKFLEGMDPKDYRFNLERIWCNRDNTDNHHKIAREGGCGSVMRAWPIGLIFWNSEDRAAYHARTQSMITHRHPMAISACAALAVGVAVAVQ